MRERIAWLDIAKAICITLVVLMHSTLGVEKAVGETGWLNWLAEFSVPFRMPDFSLIAGLFLAARIDQPWRSYLDRRVLHFAYLYVLWLTINFAVKAPAFAAEVGWDGVARDYLIAFVDPWGALWFIYHLALFFLVTRLLRPVPWPVVWLAAAALEIAHVETGWMLPDQFAARFVYSTPATSSPGTSSGWPRRWRRVRSSRWPGSPLGRRSTGPSLRAATRRCPSSAWRSASPAPGR